MNLESHNHQKRFFPNQSSNEKIFLLLRKHWFNYVPFFVVAVLMVLPLIALLIYWTYNPDFASFEVKASMILLAAVYLLVGLALQLYGFIGYYFDVDIVTDKRIVDISQTGLFKRQISELHLHQVQDVKTSVNGFFQTYLNFGDIDIQTAGDLKNFHFSTVPFPNRVAKIIIDLNEKHLQTLRQSGRRPKNQYDKEEPYTDSSGQNKMSLESLEEQAKKLLERETMAEKFSNAGFVKPKDSNFKRSEQKQSLDKKKSDDAADYSPSTFKEGELIEGEETNINDPANEA